MEAGFNFNKNILARDLMQFVERSGNFSKEKCVIRKGGKAIIPAVNKNLLYNVIHLQSQPAILF